MSRKPPRKSPAIKSAPKIRQIYWCRFPDDAESPEFWKTRPVVILSKTSKLRGSVIVLPCTSKSQPDNKNAVPIESPFSEEKIWVICNYITTVAVSRLSQKKREPIHRVSEKDFGIIKSRVLANLPH